MKIFCSACGYQGEALEDKSQGLELFVALLLLAGSFALPFLAFIALFLFYRAIFTEKKPHCPRCKREARLAPPVGQALPAGQVQHNETTAVPFDIRQLLDHTSSLLADYLFVLPLRSKLPSASNDVADEYYRAGKTLRELSATSQELLRNSVVRLCEQQRLHVPASLLTPLSEEEAQLVSTWQDTHPGELEYLWYSQQLNPDPYILKVLENCYRKNAPVVFAEDFVDRWESSLSVSDRNTLLGVTTAVAPTAVVPPPEAITSQPSASESWTPTRVPEPKQDDQLKSAALPPEAKHATAPKKVTPPKVKSPPPEVAVIWQEHVQPFFAENWYIVAGIIMVIAGSSLLAYYTWDKHWLLRYTIMPILLGAFTAALARVGSWVERKDVKFESTAAMLRGAAIGLLPVNFMAVALLANDDSVSYRYLAVLLMGTVYLTLFGWLLHRWCAAVHASLGWLLGGTLLFLNSLVMLGPLAQAFVSIFGYSLFYSKLLLVLGIGFHLGFFAACYAVASFTQTILSKELVHDKVVPWFFGITLTITFLQVFAWVHGSIQHLPHAYTYAPMVILGGWLILFVEHQVLKLVGSAAHERAESFLGFALILLGIFMGIGNQYMRVLSLLLASAVWLYHTFAQRNAVHYWLSLTLFILGSAAIGLLDIYPGPALPALGVVLALVLGVFGQLSRRLEKTQFHEACFGMQVTVLLLTTGIAPLVYWHYRSQSQPIVTAVYLLFIAALFGWRAFHEARLRWVHTTMAIVALALPYLGCVDVSTPTLHGNTMVFGLAILSLLWLCLCFLTKRPLILQARSTVLILYGGLAVTAMILRVMIERDTADPFSFRAVADYCGPLLMTVALVFTTYYSRSLIPAVMAMIIFVVLFPELQGTYQAVFSHIAWGTGFGSASSAMSLVLLSFYLRTLKSLSNLDEGDLFMGHTPFPWRKFDHRLFTWPLIASALFLTVRVDTWIVVKHLLSGGIGVKTSLAILVSAVTWTLLAVYHRTVRDAVLATYLGAISLFAGTYTLYWRLSDYPHWTTPVLLTALILQGLFFLYWFLERPHPWVASLLTQPMRQVLAVSSPLLSVLCLLKLFSGEQVAIYAPLLLFLALQLIWHGVAGRSRVYGHCLFWLTYLTVLCTTAPGKQLLLERLSVEKSFYPTLWLFFAIQLLHVALELRKENHPSLRPVVEPLLLHTTLLTTVIGLAALSLPFAPSQLSPTQLLCLLTLVFVTARAHASNLLLLLGMLLSYLFVHHQLFLDKAWLATNDRFDILTSPWRVSVFALLMVVAGQIGRLLFQRYSRLLNGPFGIPAFRLTHPLGVFIPATAFACAATLNQTLNPLLYNEPLQLWAPYLSAVALGLITYCYRSSIFFVLAAVMLTLGNISAVHIYLASELENRGLSTMHLLSLGYAASLLEASVIRRITKVIELRAWINRACLILAGLILVSLSLNYFTHPNLALISDERFVISALIAYLAGLYFRRAARHPGPGEEELVEFNEMLYHYGVAMMIWCIALLIPFLRTSTTALFSLAIPVLYFYARAELSSETDSAKASRYWHSAAALGLLILALYLLRGIFQMAFFPDTPIGTAHYHNNSPLIIVVGLLLLRLRGLGGKSWLAFWGGLALMTGSYFALTAIPGFSPFDFPVPGAWCAVAIAHFWTLVSNKQSPLCTALKQLAALDEDSWRALRRPWGTCLLIATQVAMFVAILDRQTSSYLIAPLLLGGTTILLHHAIIRRSAVLAFFAGAELFFALHADFLVLSYLEKDFVIWVILGLWTLALIVYYTFLPRLALRFVSTAVSGIILLMLAHILYHHPSSVTGLWAFALAAFLAGFTPRETQIPQSGKEATVAALLLWVPTWLVFFGQAPLEEQGISGALLAWPVLATAASLLATGCGARMFQLGLAENSRRWSFYRPCVFHHLLSWLGGHGVAVHTTVLWLVFVLTAGTQVTHYYAPFSEPELMMILGLYAVSCLAWFEEGRFRCTVPPYYLVQLCVLGFFAVLRRQLMLLASDSWNYEYDVWASLLVSVSLAGAKQLWDLKPREVRLPLITTLCATPVVALIWVLLHGLGTDIALVVIGLNSVNFAFLGKDEKESPYNVIAIFGFVAFVVIIFWSKLDLHFVHSYVIPVGLGILALVQLFRERLDASTRNQIRLITLLTMLGSTGYYALLDPRYTLGFNLSFALLSLLAMGLGGFLSIRLYLLLGFTGLMVDLASLSYKTLTHMERSLRMSLIGSTVLLVGAGLVFGTIYYRANRERFSSTLNSWRSRFGEWE